MFQNRLRINLGNSESSLEVETGQRMTFTTHSVCKHVQFIHSFHLFRQYTNIYLYKTCLTTSCSFTMTKLDSTTIVVEIKDKHVNQWELESKRDQLGLATYKIDQKH